MSDSMRETGTARPLTPEETAALDPGIRATVSWLRSEGFETIDSGDGRTKVDGMECAWPCPNVAIKSSPPKVVEDAARLYALLRLDHGLPMNACNVDGYPHIAATYDPADGSAIIVLANLDDAVLRGERKKWNEDR